MRKISFIVGVGAVVLAMAGAANAATIELNEWGAVSQFRTFKAVAPNFLTSNITYGSYKTPACASASAVVCDTAGTNACAVKGTSCANYGGNDVLFRITYNKSYDAISSLNSGDIYNGSPYAAPFNLTCAANTRPMLASEASGSVFSCQTVHLAASDVAGASITGSSTGTQKGPLNTSATKITRSFPATGISTSGLKEFTPLATTWTFYVNNAVKVDKCVGGSFDGNLCTAATASTDCGTGTCTTTQLDNITREMAVQIFSGQVFFWSDLGSSYTVTGATPQVNDYVVACLRHSGAGGHHVLNYALMNNGNWGANMASTQKVASSEGQYVWFNDSVTDTVKCINGGSNSASGASYGPFPNGSDTVGAIGYLDCNQPVGVANTSQYVHGIKYNGQPSHRNTLRNGNYDFYNNLYLYEKQSIAGTDQDKLINALMKYVGDPAHLSASVIGAADAACIAAKDEMQFNKGTDADYPGFVGAPIRQTP